MFQMVDDINLSKYDPDFLQFSVKFFFDTYKQWLLDVKSASNYFQQKIYVFDFTNNLHHSVVVPYKNIYINKYHDLITNEYILYFCPELVRKSCNKETFLEVLEELNFLHLEDNRGIYYDSNTVIFYKDKASKTELKEGHALWLA